MLNKNTRSVLKVLSPINKSAIISYPITGIKNDTGSLFAFFNTELFGEPEFSEFGLMDTSEISTLIDTIGEDISYDAPVITVSNETSKINYFTSKVELLEDLCRTKVEMLKTTDEGTPFLEFELSDVELQEIKKVQSVLKTLDVFEVSSQNGKIEVSVTSTSKSSNTFTKTFPGTINEPITVNINMESIQKIPSGNYKVRLTRTPKGNPITRFDSSSITSLAIIAATKAV